MSRLTFVVAGTLILGLSSAAGIQSNAISASPVSEHERREVRRLRSHFDSVLLELEAADVSALSRAQQARRARHIVALRAYRDYAVFPRNEGGSSYAIPYFVDRLGTHCAMAHLIARSGRADIVSRIAAERNNAFIRELADDTALVAWLDREGLTRTEAARIQPSYGLIIPPRPPRDGVSASYAAGSLLVGVLEGASIAFNTQPYTIEANARRRGALGVLAGLTGVWLGAAGLHEDGDTRSLGVANLSLGVVTTAIALRQLGRKIPAPPVVSREPQGIALQHVGLTAMHVGSRVRPALTLSARF